ncbi:MAG: hypothetical protein M3017_10520 [Actinomycetota bacterium]|nr:hypothetical protein [Actinomycetota bacterium]
MTPSQSPVLQTAPADWWQVLAALSPPAILIAGVAAAVVGLLTLRQRSRADARAQWWSRAQWALDSALSRDRKQAEMGLRVMKVLAGSELARSEEIEILTVAWEAPLQSAGRTLGPRPSVRPSAKEVPDADDDSGERAVQIAAARLRLVTDLRLEKATPEWVKSLAAQGIDRGRGPG